MTKIRLVALIVSYNRLEKLKKAINQWLRTNVYKVVIVDNNSDGNVKRFLREKEKNSKKIICLFQEKNIGGAGGFFKGMEFIHHNIDYDWIVLHDDDAYPDTKSINYFLNEKKTNPQNVYMSAVYTPDGRISPMNIPGFNPFKDIKTFIKTALKGSKGFHISPEAYKTNQQLKVDFASFVGLFISRQIVDKIGYPKADFFIYADDLEYTLRITSSGVNIFFDPKLKFIHDIETLNSKRGKVYSPTWKAYFTYRNNIFIYKLIAGKLFPIVLSIKVTEWFLNTFFYKEKKLYLKLTKEAIVDGLKENFNKSLEILEKFSDSK